MEDTRAPRALACLQGCTFSAFPSSRLPKEIRSTQGKRKRDCDILGGSTVDEKPLRSGKVRPPNLSQMSKSQLEHQPKASRAPLEKASSISRKGKRNAARRLTHDAPQRRLRAPFRSSPSRRLSIPAGSSSNQHTFTPKASDSTLRQDSHPSFLDIETAIPLFCLNPLIGSNYFYQMYRDQDSGSLPSRSGENLIHCSSVERFNVSPRRWNDDHVLSLRILPFTDLPLSYLIPAKFLEDDEVTKEILRESSLVTLEDLEDIEMADQLREDNKFLGELFMELSLTLNESSINVPQFFFSSMLNPILEQYPFESGDDTSRLKVRSDTNPWNKFKIPGPKKWTFEPPHFIHATVVDDSSVPISNVEGRPTILLACSKLTTFDPQASASILVGGANGVLDVLTADPESKPSNGGDHKEQIETATCSKHLRGASIPSDPSYAEDLAYMLGQIEFNVRGSGEVDQEAFLIRLTYTRMTISVGLFPDSLLRDMATDKYAPLGTKHLGCLLQSSEYDLAITEQRNEALKGIIALVRFITSGEAKVKLFQE